MEQLPGCLQLVGAVLIVVLAFVGAAVIGGLAELLFGGVLGGKVGFAIGLVGGAVAALGTILCTVAGIVGGALTRKRQTVYYEWQPPRKVNLLRLV